MQPLKLPRHCDEPMYFLVWKIDEFVPFFIAFAVGIMINQKFLAMLGGYVLVKVYRRIKEGSSDGYLLHLGYWYGLIGGKGYTMPNPFEKNYLP